MTISPTTVARIARINEQIKLLEQERDDLWEDLGDLEVRDYAAGDYILKVTENRRFDPSLAKKALPATKYKKILKAKPDTALAKAVLEEDEFAACQRVLGVRRQIVPVEDEDE